MFIIPLQPVPNQTVNTQLTGQNCNINAYQRFYGLFFDLYVNNTLIIGGVFCLNQVLLVRSTYLGFIGDFSFYDMTGKGNNPTYTGLGSQFNLIYLTPADITNLNLPVGVS